MCSRLRVCKEHAVEALLEQVNGLLALLVGRAAVDDGIGQAFFLELGDQVVFLVLPVEEHHAVVTLLGEIGHQLVARSVDADVVLTFQPLGVRGARCDLHQLRHHAGCVQGTDHFAAGQGRHSVLLELLVQLGLLRRHVVRHRILVVRWNVDALFELVAHHHVLNHAAHSDLGTGLVGPLQHVRLRSDLLRRLRRVAELIERLAQTLAVIEDEHLVPEIGDRVAVRRASEAVAVLEVLLDLVHRLRAPTGVVLEGGQLVDDERVEALEELGVLLHEPVHSVGVRHVDIRRHVERLFTLVGRRHGHSDLRGELLEVVFPRAAEERLGGNDQGCPAASGASSCEQFDLHTSFATSGI